MTKNKIDLGKKIQILDHDLSELIDQARLDKIDLEILHKYAYCLLEVFNDEKGAENIFELIKKRTSGSSFKVLKEKITDKDIALGSI